MTREEEIERAARREAYLYNEYYNFQQGAKWADEHPNWIGVEDELPAPSTKVLVYQGLDEAVPGYYSHDGTFKDRDGYKLADVTHWIAFPKVPKGGKQ